MLYLLVQPRLNARPDAGCQPTHNSEGVCDDSPRSYSPAGLDRRLRGEFFLLLQASSANPGSTTVSRKQRQRSTNGCILCGFSFAPLRLCARIFSRVLEVSMSRICLFLLIVCLT